MEQFQQYDVLRMIFSYLNWIDLDNAAKVSRAWMEAANDERQSRGPEYRVRNFKEKKNQNNFASIHKDLTENFRKKPSLNIFCFLNTYMSELQPDCYCRHMPLNNYTLELLFTCNIQSERAISSLSFPEETNIQITTLTFLQHYQYGRIYCKEAKLWFDSSLLNTNLLKSMFKPFFDNNRSTKSCLIFICECRSTISQSLQIALKLWFPNRNIPVWGGKIFYLSVCNRKSRECGESVSGAVVLINGTDMETFSICIDGNINTQVDIENKLQILKQNIKLKNHSIGLIFVSKAASKLYNLQLNTIKQFFPKMILASYFGLEAYGGNNDVSYTKITSLSDSLPKTTFMIITYN